MRRARQRPLTLAVSPSTCCAARRRAAPGRTKRQHTSRGGGRFGFTGPAQGLADAASQRETRPLLPAEGLTPPAQGCCRPGRRRRRRRGGESAANPLTDHFLSSLCHRPARPPWKEAGVAGGGARLQREGSGVPGSQGRLCRREGKGRAEGTGCHGVATDTPPTMTRSRRSSMDKNGSEPELSGSHSLGCHSWRVVPSPFSLLGPFSESLIVSSSEKGPGLCFVL